MRGLILSPPGNGCPRKAVVKAGRGAWPGAAHRDGEKGPVSRLRRFSAQGRGFVEKAGKGNGVQGRHSFVAGEKRWTGAFCREGTQRSVFVGRMLGPHFEHARLRSWLAS